MNKCSGVGDNVTYYLDDGNLHFMDACSIVAHNAIVNGSFDVMDGISEVWCHAYTFDVDCGDDKYNVDDVTLDVNNVLCQDFEHELNDKDLWFLENKHDKIMD